MGIRPLKVVSIMEGYSVTGPAKILLEFGRCGRKAYDGLAPVELSVAAYRRGDEPESELIQAAREAGFPVDVIYEKGRFDSSVAAQFNKIVEERKPDIIETNNIKSHFFMRLSGISRSSMWIAVHHGYTNEDWRMRLYNSTSGWSFRGAHRVLTVCRPFVEQLVEKGVPRENILVRPNAVGPFIPPEQQLVDAARAEIGAQDGAKLIVAIGRLSQEKGHANLLEAFALLNAKRLPQPLHLVIVGEGGERSALEEQCSRLGIGGQVSLVGLKSNVRPYFILADVFVLPSHSEGSPLALLEAMAAGVPIVATSVGGVPDTVTAEESALLVPPASPVAMAEAIERLLLEKDLAAMLGSRARWVVETEFSRDRYTQEKVRMYSELLEQTWPVHA
jgi:glycosyltransferase involved in cell wall biosynthesis